MAFNSFWNALLWNKCCLSLTLNTLHRLYVGCIHACMICTSRMKPTYCSAYIHTYIHHHTYTGPQGFSQGLGKSESEPASVTYSRYSTLWWPHTPFQQPILYIGGGLYHWYMYRHTYPVLVEYTYLTLLYKQIIKPGEGEGEGEDGGGPLTHLE